MNASECGITDVSVSEYFFALKKISLWYKTSIVRSTLGRTFLPARLSMHKVFLHAEIFYTGITTSCHYSLMVMGAESLPLHRAGVGRIGKHNL